ncbi:TetR/AcrR family transcriptional regulator [soil metagenome]
MSTTSKEIILKKALKIFAKDGYDGLSMRILADAIPIAPSVLYHHFTDKDALLKAMFDDLNSELGKKRAKLFKPQTASEMLKQRIIFQLDNAEAIVAVLKYYLVYRKRFPKLKTGFVPEKGYLHIEEVLNYGVQTGEFYSPNIQEDAKVMTHAINGFLLEYYPHTPKGEEKEVLVSSIHQFLIRALTKGGEKK